MKKSDYTFYMLVTKDKYELPISPPLTLMEMAERLGIKPESVRFRTSPVFYKRCKFVKNLDEPKLIRVVLLEDKE